MGVQSGQSLGDRRGKQERARAAVLEAGHVIVQPCDLVIQADPVQEVVEQVARRFDAHHGAARKRAHLAAGEQAAHGSEQALELLDPQVVGVADGAVDVEA